MKLYYICECCQKLLSQIEMDEMDSLTPQGRKDIMNQEIYINSLCQECISALGLDQDQI